MLKMDESLEQDTNKALTAIQYQVCTILFQE
jgi:hypothetical protein